MKLRVQNDRIHSDDCSRPLKQREPPTVMQTNCNELNAYAENGLSLTLQPELLTRTPATGGSNPAATGEVRVPISGAPDESSGRPSSRRSRAGAGTHSHAHSHGHSRTHSHEPEPDPGDADVDSGEPSSSLSEMRYLFRWIQKSLPFIVILCAKLIIQHALGLAVGVGLFTTFLYVNKNVQGQVFLQGRRSKLHCVWLLLFLTGSTLLLYYTFLPEALYHCLIFLSPSVEPLDVWQVLWAVGVTSFTVKFLFLALKCLILLMPSAHVGYKARVSVRLEAPGLAPGVLTVTLLPQGRWYILLEEVGQLYQVVTPVPVWFRYLITYQEEDGSTGLTLGILLALVYLILKLLGLYGQWGSFLKALRLFLSDEHNGAPATKGQCAEAGDVCPICQGSFKEPRVLLCQHIFCDECVALWFSREKSCPLCRTVITDKIHKWRDGASSPYLQVY